MKKSHEQHTEKIIDEWSLTNRKSVPGPPNKQLVDHICTEVPEYSFEFVEQILQEDWYQCVHLVNNYYTPGVYLHFLSREMYPLIAKTRPSLEGLTAIDVGCAEGFFSFCLEEKGADVTSIDFSRLKLKHAKFLKKIKNSSIDINYINIFDKKLKTFGKFDIVWSTDILQHLEEGQNSDVVNAKERYCQILYDLCDWSNAGTIIVSVGHTHEVSTERDQLVVIANLEEKLMPAYNYFSELLHNLYINLYLAHVKGTPIRPYTTYVGIMEIKSK